MKDANAKDANANAKDTKAVKDVIFEINGVFVNPRDVSHSRQVINFPGVSLYLIMRNDDAIFVTNGSDADIDRAKEKLKWIFASYAEVVDLGKLLKEKDED